MKKTIKGFGLLLLVLVLAACQSTDETNTGSATEQRAHSESEKSDQEVPKGVLIEGLAAHYHTGDKIELTAFLKEEAEGGHWLWYSRASSSDEWEMISGQESAGFTGKATSEVAEIKAVFYGEGKGSEVQSAPAEIVIDDHHVHDEATTQIYDGYFEDEQVADRGLSDWEGDWQSVYPYLVSGDLDEVFAHKAETGDMTAEEYKQYYTTGYITNIDRVLIKDESVTFFDGKEEYSGEYASDGYEILTYEKGNRGVRFIFKKTAGSEQAPAFIQFSDHHIYPVKSSHFHLYWGADRKELLEEVTHWPTYYPSDLDAKGLVRDMLAH